MSSTWLYNEKIIGVREKWAGYFFKLGLQLELEEQHPTMVTQTNGHEKKQKEHLFQARGSHAW